MQIRLLKDIETSAAEQMAIDEAILNARIRGIVGNTLRFYTWKPKAVSIGYFQSIKQEVNLDFAGKKKIDVVRRYTGGGAVFHDMELTYSIVIEEFTPDIIESYKKICSALIFGFKKLNINAVFKPINDIIVSNKKISGNAQTRKNGFILQHGTILLDINFEMMISVLKNLKHVNIREALTSVKSETGEYDIKKVKTAMLNGFKEAFNCTFVEGNLTSEELKTYKKLTKKYKSEEWNFKR